MILVNIVIIFLLIGLNAFFVSVEFAVVTARRARLDLLADEQHRAARLVRKWLESASARNRLIAATQLGQTIASLALGAIGQNTFEALLQPYFATLQLPGWIAFIQAVIPVLPLVISLVIITSLHVVLGEQVPKVAVLRTPERFALFVAPLMQVFLTIFKWSIDVLDRATRLVLRLIGLSDGSALATYSLEEVRQMVSGPEVEGLFEEPERKMLSAVLDFGAMVVRQVSVPRTEIIAVPGDATVSEASQVAVEHSFNKMPVYENSLDQINGVVHLHDLVQALQAGESQRPVREIKRDALFVPETISVNDLLHQFRSHKSHMAIVLDEFGGTSGLVTLENLLEEIVGEVQDTLGDQTPDIQALPDGTALVDGMTLIDEINEHFGMELSDPHYDTIAGYVLGKLGRIPREGDEVVDDEHHIVLKVTSMDRLRIAQVSLKRQ
ncbi:MAG: hemolysin family protein [Anaerolineaceae bacterium]